MGPIFYGLQYDRVPKIHLTSQVRAQVAADGAGASIIVQPRLRKTIIVINRPPTSKYLHHFTLASWSASTG